MECCRGLMVLAAVGLLSPTSAGTAAPAGGAAAETARPVQEAVSRDALKNPSQFTDTAPEVFRARFETSKGAFVIEVHRAWAPFAADRFYNLVKSGFYDGTRFFRVRPGFMAQFGLHGDPDVQRAWQTAPLDDDPVTQKNVRGFVTFTTENRPRSRFTQVFINYADNTYLDADGFAPFGRIVSGMEVVERLYGYEKGKEPDQRRILREGNEYLEKEFPMLDYVKKAVIE